MDWNIYSNGRALSARPYAGEITADESAEGWRHVGRVKDADLDFDAMAEYRRLFVTLEGPT